MAHRSATRQNCPRDDETGNRQSPHSECLPWAGPVCFALRPNASLSPPHLYHVRSLCVYEKEGPVPFCSASLGRWLGSHAPPPPQCPPAHSCGGDGSYCGGVANPKTKGWLIARDQGIRCLSPIYKEKSPAAPTAAPADQLSGPHSRANDAERTDPLVQQAPMRRHTSRREDWVTVQGPGRKTMLDAPRSTRHRRSRPSTGPHAHTNEATHTSPTAKQTTMTQRTLRRDHRVFVQGPAGHQRRTKCEMSHGGWGGTRWAAESPNRRINEPPLRVSSARLQAKHRVALCRCSRSELVSRWPQRWC